MPKDDWAIVVGIQRYFDPGLTGLQGPENDATDFYKWVISSEGGAVPEGQAKLIRSSDFPPFTTESGAMPTRTAIKEAFDHILSVADDNERKGLGRTVGNRLYLFFSGHGFTPSHHDELTALLTAEASVADAKLTHVIGSYMADKFWRGKFFKEVMLFMDCCRDIMDCAQLYTPYDDERGTDFYKGVRFYAYGARVAKESREWMMADGLYHGVFTKTLMDGLGGAAYDPDDPSKITAESLRDQLYNGFKNFMSAADRKRPDLPKEPEVVFEQKPGGNFTIVTRGNFAQRILGRTKGTTYQVTIFASAPRLGKKASIRNSKLDVVSEQTLVAQTTLSLPRGFYAIDFGDSAEEVTFEVTGAGGEVRA